MVAAQRIGVARAVKEKTGTEGPNESQDRRERLELEQRLETLSTLPVLRLWLGIRIVRGHLFLALRSFCFLSWMPSSWTLTQRTEKIIISKSSREQSRLADHFQDWKGRSCNWDTRFRFRPLAFLIGQSSWRVWMRTGPVRRKNSFVESVCFDLYPSFPCLQMPKPSSKIWPAGHRMNEKKGVHGRANVAARGVSEEVPYFFIITHYIPRQEILHPLGTQFPNTDRH